jgi:hypothetical protein
MNDNEFLVYDDADATKNLKFQLSGITPGQTRVITIPDKSGTLATTDAADLTTGTLADARLSTNVPLLDAANTFSANQTLDGTNNVAPNQTAASGASLLTRDLGDARYGQVFIARTTATQTVTNNTTMQASTQGGTLTLGAGTYQLFFLIRTVNDVAAGGKTQLSLSASAAFLTGQEVVGVNNFAGVVFSAAYTNLIGLRQTTNQNNFSHAFSGIIQLTASTTLTMNFANFAASGDTALQANSYILARQL